MRKMLVVDLAFVVYISKQRLFRVAVVEVRLVLGFANQNVVHSDIWLQDHDPSIDDVQHGIVYTGKDVVGITRPTDWRRSLRTRQDND